MFLQPPAYIMTKRARAVISFAWFIEGKSELDAHCVVDRTPALSCCHLALHRRSARYVCSDASCCGHVGNHYIRLHVAGAREAQTVRSDFRCHFCGSRLEEDVASRVQAGARRSRYKFDETTTKRHVTPLVVSNETSYQWSASPTEVTEHTYRVKWCAYLIAVHKICLCPFSLGSNI